MRLFSANEWTLESYLSQFDVEKLEMASVMGICAGLMGPKSENVKISSAWIRPKWAYKQQTHIFPTYFACPKEALARQESEPKRQRNDRSENMSSKEALSDPFRSPKSKVFD